MAWRKLTLWLLSGAAIAAAIVVHGMAPRAAAPGGILIQPNGPEQTVFLHSRDACRPEDIPDLPARAFRDSSGRVHLFATHFVDYGFIGANLNSVKRNCTVVYQGAGSDDPAQFNDHAWLASFRTDDGKTVYALVHNEFQGNLRPWLCPSRVYFQCWYNSVTAAISTDGGFHFKRQGSAIVAAPAYRFSSSVGHPVGYFGSSNVIQKAGYYFVMVFAEGIGGQQRGNCLLRTRELSRVRDWRAWDGRAFDVRLGNPYDRPPEAHPPVCTPLEPTRLQTHILSLVQYRPTGQYLALMSIESGRDPGFYVSSSTDLFHWAEPKKFLDNWPVADGKCHLPEARAYASLLDPNSPSRNFDTVGDTAYLYFTRFNLKKCAIDLDRDLARMPVRIAISR